MASPNVIFGTSLDEVLVGLGDADHIFGFAGNDTLTGNGGDDLLAGGAGSDVLEGGAGDDILIGGADSDQLYGGAGRDTFVFTVGAGATSSGAADRLNDFAAEDWIGVYAADFGLSEGNGLINGALDPAWFVVGKSATASGHGQFIFTGGKGKSDLLWDPDGTGPAGAIYLASFKPGMTVTASQFKVFTALPTASVAALTSADTAESAPSVGFALSLSQPWYQDIVLTYSTVDGTALGGSDFVARSGVEVVIPAGTTTVHVSVALIDDTVPEGPETFALKIDSARVSGTSTTLPIGTASASAVIADNDSSPPPPVNTAPVITSPNAASVPENQTAVLDVQATDDSSSEGAGLSYSLAGGADAALFAIDAASGVVTFLAAPDFEAPGDANGDNAYQIRVRVTDAGGLTAEQDITVTVTDAAENTAPVITSPNAASVPENQTAVLDIQTTDDSSSEGTGLSYSLVGGADAALFAIAANSGVVTFLAAPDFENPADANGDNLYQIRVRVTDAGGLWAEQDITVTVTDVAETGAPTITSPAAVSVRENQTAVLDVQATDDSSSEGAGLSYGLVGGADAALFTIDAASGVVTFLTPPDFEAPGDANGDNAYQIRVRVTDAGGLWDEQDITVTVTDVISLIGDFGYQQYKVSNLSDGTIIDAETATFTMDNDNSDGTSNPYPIDVNNSSNVILDGGTVIGEIDLLGDWTDVYALGNSAAIRVEFAPNIVIRDWRVDGVWDAIRVSWNSPGFLIEDVWLSNVRDDAIENDKLSSGTIRDSLIDGARSGISVDPSSSSPVDGSNEVVTIEGVLLRLQLSLRNGEIGHGSPIKTDSSTNGEVTPSLRFFNNVIAIEDVNHDYRDMFDAWAHTIESSGNYFLNLSDTPLPSDYPMPPEDWTILQGQEARDYWEQARDAWIASHPDDGTPPDPGENPVPVITSPDSVSVAENQTAVLDVQATDDADSEGAGLDYAITGGADAALFSLDAGTGVLAFLSSPDFEAPGDADADNVYEVQVTVTDSGGLSGVQAIAVTVTDVWEDPALGIFETRVSSSKDDAEERASGSTSINSSDLELVTDGSKQQTVGIRFTGIDVPQGATITNAYIEFQVDEVSTGAVSLTIRGEDVDDAATFAATSFNISSRATTDAFVFWTPPDWTTVGAAGPDQRTPDLNAIVQEIVDRSDWATLNDMVFIITGSGRRTAEAYDGNSLGAPLLHIEYLLPDPSGNPIVSANPPGAEFML